MPTFDEAVAFTGSGGFGVQAENVIAVATSFPGSGRLEVSVPGANPTIVDVVLSAITPVVTLGAIVNPTLLSLPIAVIAPTVTVGATVVQPTILTMGLGLLTAGGSGPDRGLVVAQGLVPRLRLRRVTSRYAVRLVRVTDGLETSP